MDTETTGRAQAELGQAQRGDARRTQRLVKLAEQRAAQPHASLPSSCGSPAAQAAYRFYDHDAIPPDEILASHRQSTQKRLASEAVVLAVQDTTELDDPHHPASQGGAFCTMSSIGGCWCILPWR
ncbi:MAG: transposase DNA-binding-containing protein [Abditibacteriales bacterium]|nr:transposase DNA-binding-containing protein [Abditibacteriales bacterium]MDW8367479.1 transposase DNA-binding-containing protein [Abditibacteriales bacterium]